MRTIILCIMVMAGTGCDSPVAPSALSKVPTIQGERPITGTDAPRE